MLRTCRPWRSDCAVGCLPQRQRWSVTGEVEPDARASSGIDEACVVAGHKGQPAAAAKRGGSGAVASWQARRVAAGLRRASRPSSG